MAGVFVHRRDTHYDDKPDERYQFPKIYLSRAAQIVGDWAVYYEPLKAGGRGFYAVAFVEQIIPDPSRPDHYLALIRKGDYIDFPKPVPHRIDGELVEAGLRNAQAALRTLDAADFVRIINLGLGDDETFQSAAQFAAQSDNSLSDVRTPFLFSDGDERRKILTSRTARDTAFRAAVVSAYDKRCAFTGLQFINGGGKAEVEAAHIKSVEAKGPDSINNGIALSRTVHWMFDRGLLTLEDDSTIRISRHVNDLESIERLLRPELQALLPADPAFAPRPDFLAWHRSAVFKH